MDRGGFEVIEVSWCDFESSLSSIRSKVFIEEQNVPEALEWDGLDADAVHLLAVTQRSEPIGTVRLLLDGHIGRMAVVKEWRNKGVGHALLAHILEVAANKNIPHIELNAQTTALGFYEKSGFQPVGEEFMDAGIPHFRMIYR